MPQHYAVQLANSLVDEIFVVSMMLDMIRHSEKPDRELVAKCIEAQERCQHTAALCLDAARFREWLETAQPSRLRPPNPVRPGRSSL